MNGHCFTTTASNPDLPVSIHTIPPDSLSRLLVCKCQFTNCQIPPLTTFAANLKLHTNWSSNHVTSLVLTPFKPLPPRDPDHLSFFTTYYPGLHHLKRILREGFHILSSDPSIQDLLTIPLSITFRKPPYLANQALNFSPNTS